jgi:hypothetical protein
VAAAGVTLAASLPACILHLQICCTRAPPQQPLYVLCIDSANTISCHGGRCWPHPCCFLACLHPLPCRSALVGAATATQS